MYLYHKWILFNIPKTFNLECKITCKTTLIPDHKFSILWLGICFWQNIFLISNYSSSDMSKKGEEKNEAKPLFQSRIIRVKKTVAAIEQHCALWTDRVRSYFWATASQRCIYATWPSWSWPSMLLEMPAQPLPQPLSTAASRRRARGARCAAAELFQVFVPLLSLVSQPYWTWFRANVRSR